VHVVGDQLTGLSSENMYRRQMLQVWVAAQDESVLRPRPTRCSHPARCSNPAQCSDITRRFIPHTFDPMIQGCRHFEIDCWDGRSSDPVVTRGHTFCTKVRFLAVAEAVGQCAFVTSRLPVILSMESEPSANHTTQADGDRP
jgi:hypothetical protein